MAVMPSSLRRATFNAKLAAIVGAALALRVLYVFVVDPDLGDHFFGLGDWLFYHGQANLIADGHGFSEPGVPGRASADHPPLWPLVLSVASSLGGEGLQSHRVVGALVGTAAVGATGLLGRSVAGDRVGLLASAGAAIYPVLIAADGSLMSESLYGLMVVVVLLAALRLQRLRTTGSAIVFGAAVGVAALARTEVLLLLPLLAAPLCARIGDLSRPARAGRLLAICVAAALVIAPWTVRNAIQFDRPVLVAVNEAAVVAGANCDPAYHGDGTGFWRFECISPPPRGRNVADAPHWRSAGIDYASEHAGDLPRVVAIRILRTWDLWVPFDQQRFATERHLRVAQAGVLAFYALVPLAILGVVVVRRRDEPGLLVLLAPVGMVTLASAIGYGSDRFRHAAEFSLLVLAAAAVDHFFARRPPARARTSR